MQQEGELPFIELEMLRPECGLRGGCVRAKMIPEVRQAAAVYLVCMEESPGSTEQDAG